MKLCGSCSREWPWHKEGCTGVRPILNQCASGETYEHDLDHGRLAAQRQRVWDFMVSGDWHTLAEIAAATGDPEASVSARLRDFRKERFGGHKVERSRIGPGTFAYRLVVRVAA